MLRKVLTASLAVIALATVNPAFAQKRLSLSSGPVLSTDTTSSTLYWTYGPSDPAALTLDVSGLGYGVYDVYAYGGNLCAAPTGFNPDPLIPPSGAPITGGTTITTGTSPLAWINPSSSIDGVTSKLSANGAIASTNGSRVAANSGMSNFIGIDLGAGNSQVATQLTLWEPTDSMMRGDGTTALPVQIDASSDGSTWTTLTSTTINISGPLPQPGFVVPFVNTTAYRFYRVGIQGDNVHSLWVAQQQWSGPPPAVTRVQPVFNGSGYTNNSAIAGCSGVSIPADAGAYLGTVMTDAAGGSISCKFSYGQDSYCGVWNVVNQLQICLRGGDGRTGSGNYTPGSFGSSQPPYLFGPTENNAAIRLRVLSGFGSPSVLVEYRQQVFLNGQSAYWSAIGVNSTSTPSGYWGIASLDNATPVVQKVENAHAVYVGALSPGVTSFNAIEGQRSNLTINGKIGEPDQLMFSCVQF